MAGSHAFGRRAEAMVAAHLRARGWRILHRNWRFRHVEVDLIAEREGLVAFVEVKGRDQARWGHPLDSIGPGKRRAVLLAARAWLAAHGRRGQAYRFDAAVVIRQRNRIVVEYFEDAWRF